MSLFLRPDMRMADQCCPPTPYYRTGDRRSVADIEGNAFERLFPLMDRDYVGYVASPWPVTPSDIVQTLGPIDDSVIAQIIRAQTTTQPGALRAIISAASRTTPSMAGSPRSTATWM